jgi:hypothetical protein
MNRKLIRKAKFARGQHCPKQKKCVKEAPLDETVRVGDIVRLNCTNFHYRVISLCEFHDSKTGPKQVHANMIGVRGEHFTALVSELVLILRFTNESS